jgi:hypothetical protein
MGSAVNSLYFASRKFARKPDGWAEKLEVAEVIFEQGQAEEAHSGPSPGR